MQPLTPDNLLLRRSPMDQESLANPGVADTKSEPVVTLERFQALEHVIRDVPLHVDPYMELARIYLQNSRWSDAKRILDLACERFPEHEDANCLREEAQLARSLQLHGKALIAHQSEPTRLTEGSLERCHIELNVLRQKVCLARLRRHPEQAELNLPLAAALHNLGQHEEAISRLQMAVGYPELRALAALQLGRVLEHVGRIPEALSAYRRCALFRVPPPPVELKIEALSAAAELAERKNLIDSARRYTQLLLELQPENRSLQQKLSLLSGRAL